MLARVCARETVSVLRLLSSVPEEFFLSGGVVAGRSTASKFHTPTVSFFSRKWLVKLPPDCPYRVRGKKEENYERKTRDCLRHLRTDEKALYDAVAKVIEQYKEKEGSLIMVLHAAQEIFGYLPMELQEFIATAWTCLCPRSAAW